ncbi:MAG: acylneuraminate cytidylyltransferase family protein [Erythrobacter sp.]|nr:acylneuraminate cytidylyltransferase family protein [Erythrobacter sp.]
MIDGRRITALIPARAGSKGLPGKNTRDLLGKPLLAWPIEAALGCALVDDVVISTDSADMARIAETHGARAPFLRPAELASDEAPSIDFILHALDALAIGDEDYLVLLEPTSPLTEAQDIAAALTALHANRDTADAIVGIAPLVTVHPDFAVSVDDAGRIAPASDGDFGALPRRQDIRPLYALDGSLYIAAAVSLRSKRSFCHDRTLGFAMPRHKAHEVDDLVDFLCIEAIARNLNMIEDAEKTGALATGTTHA